MPGMVPNHMIEVEFNGGPKNGEVVEFAVPDSRGAPDRIEVRGVNPLDGTIRHGLYLQSAFHPRLYSWGGWTTDPMPFTPLTSGGSSA